MAEKLGILRDIGDIKEKIAQITAEMKALVEIKKANHEEIKEIVKKHDSIIYGNGHEGMRTQLDRLMQEKQVRESKEESTRAHYLAIYGGLILLAIKEVFSYFAHGR